MVELGGLGIIKEYTTDASQSMVWNLVTVIKIQGLEVSAIFEID